MEAEFSSEQVAIVTGACSGIGAAVAKQLAQKGVGHITITGLTIDGLEATKNSIIAANSGTQVFSLQGDLRNEALFDQIVQGTVDKFGRIDILISNAGWLFHGPVSDQPLENYQITFDINVKPAVALTKLCLPYLRKSKGSIVITSSNLAIRPAVEYTFYCMSKAALDTFTRCMAAEEGKNGIRINNVNPGLTDSGLAEKVLGEEKAAKFFEDAKSFPVPRAAFPEEIANVITFVAGRKASYMTGSCVVTDGGLICYNPL